MKKTSKHIVREIVVEEWYKVENNVVYQVWRLPTGEKIERPTPCKEIPFVQYRYEPKS